jgi:hypothetical protein
MFRTALYVGKQRPVRWKIIYQYETNQGTVTLVFVERLLGPPRTALNVDHGVQGVLALSGRLANRISKLIVGP